MTYKKRMKKTRLDLSMRSCGRRSGSVALGHAVADAHLCKQILRLGGVFFDFPADVGHVHPEDLVVAAGPGAPQLLDDEIIRQDLACVFAQQGHDAELAEGEMDVFPADTDLVLVVVDDQLSHRIGAVPGDFIVAGDGAGVADGGADPGQELVRAEGLGEVVVRPQIQRGDLVPLVGAGGDHHHRQAGPTAQAAENVQAIHVRQAEVQNDQIGTVGGDHGKRLLAGLGLHGLIAIVIENRGNEVRDALLILDYQNFFLMAKVSFLGSVREINALLSSSSVRNIFSFCLHPTRNSSSAC